MSSSRQSLKSIGLIMLPLHAVLPNRILVRNTRICDKEASRVFASVLCCIDPTRLEGGSRRQAWRCRIEGQGSRDDVRGVVAAQCSTLLGNGQFSSASSSALTLRLFISILPTSPTRSHPGLLFSILPHQRLSSNPNSPIPLFD